MSKADIGVYGLGTMGSALALNMAEKGFKVAITNREVDWIPDLLARAGDLATGLAPHDRLEDFVASLQTPRVILFMIPSGAPMDSMIEAVTPLLQPGDTIIDGGNADFHDTRRRAAQLAPADLHFVGMGTSGGQEGARHGPCLMVGGSDHSWAQLEPILTRIAASYKGTPCVAHLGPDGAGHFVKTVHNGIEYAEMQSIAEICSLLRNGRAFAPAQIGRLFEAWNDGPLHSYLIEITARLMQCTDPLTGHPMVDVIKDSAGQKGTGRWTVIEAQKLGQGASMIEAAVAARSWSSEKETRQEAERILGGARGAIALEDEVLEEALRAVRLLGYAQGFRLLSAASDTYGWALDHTRIARVWRAGCIIRSAMLDDIAETFDDAPPEGHLILAPAMARILALTVPSLRSTVAAAVSAGHAVPALAAALSWYDSMRQGFGTANIIQAQRDVFGRHGFERLGASGLHHGPWSDTHDMP